MAKLTLSVDEHVVAQAKAFAAQHDTSVSKLVEEYLARLAGSESKREPLPPVLRALRGSLRVAPEVDVLAEYRNYLEKKYS